MVNGWSPGPWFAGRLVKSDEDYDFGTVSIGQQDLGDRPNKDAHYEDTICEVWQNPNLAEDAEANARLIAASPTMAEYIQRKADEGDQEAARIMEIVRGEHDHAN